MATPVADSIALTNDARIDGLAQGGAWQFGTGPRQLVYSLNINDSEIGGNPVGGTWDDYPAMVDAVERAFAEWAKVANLSFVRIDSGTYYYESDADLAVTLTGDELFFSDPTDPNDVPIDAASLGFFPDTDFGNLIREAAQPDFTYPRPEGDLFFDNYLPAFSAQNLGAGGLGFTYIVHEIGHALGLKHPGDDGANERPTFSALGIGGLDTPLNTLMSEAAITSGTLGTGNVATPMLLDILAIQHIYGANATYASGNDVYSLLDDGAIRAIWDTGGFDTFDASAIDAQNGVDIDLRAGAVSVLGTHTQVAIAYGVVIENAIGTLGADTIHGNDGENRLDGGEEDEGGQVDALYGHGGNDTYVIRNHLDSVFENSGEGTDTIEAALSLALPDNVENLRLTGTADLNGTGNSVANVVEGNSGANILQGEGGNDTLLGAGGNDTLIGGAGNDLLNGGDGVDTASYTGGSVGIEARFDLGWILDPSGGTDTLTAMEGVIGTDHSDVLIGLIGAANVLAAGGGDDFIFFDHLDQITGGSGVDRAVALGTDGVTLTMSDIEWLWGTNGVDVANASAQTVTVTIFGMDGNDIITGGSGNDQLYGQGGADTLIGGDGDDWLYIDSADILSGSVQGGSGSDRAASLDGSAVALNLGTSSIEWVWASNFADTLDGTSQTNPLNLYAFDGVDTLRGGSGNDNLYGMAGADALYGGAGNDVLYFDSDDTVVEGGGDYDTAQVLDYTGVGVSLNLGTSQIEAVYASNQSDTLDASTATWAVYMNGYNGDDVMSGGSADDNIYGGGGADTISGGGGNDFLDAGGGPEVDTLAVSGLQAEYILHYTGGVLTSVQDLVGGRDGWDNVVGFERIDFSDGLLSI